MISDPVMGVHFKCHRSKWEKIAPTCILDTNGKPGLALADDRGKSIAGLRCNPRRASNVSVQ